MNILGITNFYSSLDPLCPQAIQKPIETLMKMNVDVKVISPIPITNKFLSKKWSEISKLPKKRRVSSVEIYHPRYIEIPRNLLKQTAGIRYNLGVQKAVKKLENFKPTIVHAHMAYPDGFAAAKLAKKFKVPYVVTARGTDLLTVKTFPTVRKMVFEILKNAERVIYPSKRIANQFSEYYSQKKFEIIPNGISLNDFENLDKNPVRYQNKKLIVSVCTLNKDKGIQINLLALSELIKTRTDFHYLIVGDGAEKNNLLNLIHQLNLTPYVTFVGKVNHKTALEYIKLSDIFSMPGWNETFGLVYLEAMYLKKPIVATFDDGIDGAALDGIHGFFAHKQNVAEVAQALDRLLSSDEIRNRFGANGHEEVLRNYTWQKHAEKIYKVYKEIEDEFKGL